MSLQHRLTAFVGVVVLLGLANVTHAQVIVADFEDGNFDGFGTGTNSGVTPGVFSSPTSGSVVQGSVGGSTDTTKVLDLTASGFNGGLGSGADLGFDFATNFKSQFLANDVITFQWGVPSSSTTGGYAQLYNIILNADGAGFHSVGGSSGATYAGVITTGTVNQNPSYSGQVFTVSIDYTAWKSSSGLAANPGYIQLEFQTNNGGGAPADFYFDNFTLSVPEPASIVLAGLGLAGLGLIAKRRHQEAA